MTSDGVQIVQTLFSSIWQLFNGWSIPGTNTTPAEWGLFILSAVIAIRFIKRFIGNRGDND